MPTRQATHQERWKEILSDPSLHDLPYTVETNERGQILLSPHSNRHSDVQWRTAQVLDRHAPGGREASTIAPDAPMQLPG